jgi:non-ribosomal peptide synthetase component F
MIEMDGLRVEPAQTKSYTRFDLEFHLSQGNNSLNGGVVYSTALFELKTIENLVAVFLELLRRTIIDPDIPIALVPLDNLVKIDNNPQQVAVPLINDLQNMSIVSVFQQQVVKSPDAIAVRHATINGEHVQQIIYAELGRQSDYLAHWLNNRKLVTESPVAVLARRSC